MDIENIKTILEVISSLITVLGVPSAIYIYFQNKRKEQIDREYGTYNALDDKYIEFLNLCLANSELNIYHSTQEKAQNLTAEQENKKLIIYEILISILERAFLMYRDQTSKIKLEQWEGWNLYMHDWLSDNDFRAAWKTLGEQWDINFIDHMIKIECEIEATMKAN